MFVMCVCEDRYIFANKYGSGFLVIGRPAPDRLMGGETNDVWLTCLDKVRLDYV